MPTQSTPVRGARTLYSTWVGRPQLRTDPNLTRKTVEVTSVTKVDRMAYGITYLSSSNCCSMKCEPIATGSLIFLTRMHHFGIIDEEIFANCHPLTMRHEALFIIDSEAKCHRTMYSPPLA